MTIDLRAFIEPQQGATYEQQLTFAQAAERIGYSAFFRSDHYLAMKEASGLPGPTDAWLTLGAIARETSKIRLGTLVTSNTFRSPGELAIIAAQVDDMSKGRLDFGLGAGWYEAEHAAYAIDFPPVQERFNRFEEALEIITGLWRTPVGELFNYQGKYYSLADSPALPKPHQNLPPIIVGGIGKVRTPAIAAKFADEFNVPFSSLVEATAVIKRVNDACHAAGRKSFPEYSVAQVICVGKNDAEVAQRAEKIGRDVADLKDAGLAGTKAEVQDKIARFTQQGIHRFYGQFLDLSDHAQLELLYDFTAGI